MEQILARDLSAGIEVRQFPTSPWILVLQVLEKAPTVIVRTPSGVMSFDRNQELQVQ